MLPAAGELVEKKKTQCRGSEVSKYPVESIEWIEGIMFHRPPNLHRKALDSKELGPFGSLGVHHAGCIDRLRIRFYDTAILDTQYTIRNAYIHTNT